MKWGYEKDEYWIANRSYHNGDAYNFTYTIYENEADEHAAETYNTYGTNTAAIGKASKIIKYKLIPFEIYEDMISQIKKLKSLFNQVKTESIKTKVNKNILRRTNTALIETMQNQIFALSEALSKIIEFIGCNPNKNCSKDCEHCENYRRVFVKYRNLITETNSIEPIPPYYDEESYGGYCTCRIK